MFQTVPAISSGFPGFEREQIDTLFVAVAAGDIPRARAVLDELHAAGSDQMAERIRRARSAAACAPGEA